jgi:hypothetical protein
VFAGVFSHSTRWTLSARDSHIFESELHELTDRQAHAERSVLGVRFTRPWRSSGLDRYQGVRLSGLLEDKPQVRIALVFTTMTKGC